MNHTPHELTDSLFALGISRELELETTATRKCIERFQMDLFDYKPHEKSMQMGYLTLICAEIPLWIVYMINEQEIDLATFEHLHPKTTEEIVAHFTENVQQAKAALAGVTDGSLSAQFALKNNGQVVYTASKRENIESAINHMVHHRGQLSVYLRLNDIAVPSLYGPSADEKGPWESR
ncbi:MAG: DinB family protein [Bacteroidota bacterium]